MRPIRPVTVRAAAVVLAMGAALVMATARPAAACSCAATSAGRLIAAADAAFVGTFVGRDDPNGTATIVSSGREVVNHFRVERVYAGSLPRRVDVRSAADGASCGIEVSRGGTRVGIALDRRPGRWHGSLCATFSPDDAAALPWRAPSGTTGGSSSLPWSLLGAAAVAAAVYGAGRRLAER